MLLVWTCLNDSLSGTGDGSVRVWRDYTQTDNHRLATSWQSVQGHKPGSRSISAVVDWHQLSGCLVRQLFRLHILTNRRLTCSFVNNSGFSNSVFIPSSFLLAIHITCSYIVQYASGQISWIMVWDLDREQLTSSIPSNSDSCVSAMVCPLR